MKHIKYFEEKALYESYINNSPILPNVSYVGDEDKVYYLINNELPNNVIRYYSEKELEFYSDYQPKNIVSHEFSDGVGTITFSENVTVVPYGFFYDYSSEYITRIELPNSITRIEGSFHSGISYASTLNHMNIPNSLTYIGKDAFYGCPLKFSSDAFSNVEYIEDFAFRGSDIKSVNLTNIKYIGKMAFCDCGQLINVTIGKNCEFIGYCAFSDSGKYGYVNIYYEGTMEQFLMMEKDPNWYRRDSDSYDDIDELVGQEINVVECSDGDIVVSEVYDEGYDEGYGEGYDEGYYNE